jgi:hypothetical protein
MDWVSKREMNEKHRIPERALLRWVAAGYVRKARLGPGKSDRALYSVDDALNVVEAFAAGRAPCKAGEA